MNFLLEKPFDFLASTIGQYVVDTWRHNSQIDSHLDNLSSTLYWGHELIRRSECWRLKYELIDKDLLRLKDIVYDAESVVDELEYQHTKQKLENSSKSEVMTDYFKNWMSSFPKRVREVQENLSKFCDKMEKICSKLKIPENHNQFCETARPVTTGFGDTYTIYGRDEELNDFIHLLRVLRSESESRGGKRKREHNLYSSAIGETSSKIEQKGNVTIIPIVGMGGMGKTTFAQMVYNDRKVRSFFTKLIWICVSENFDVLKLTREMVQCVTDRRYNHTTNLNTLQETLEKKLKSKRFLLVLDDAWSESEMAWQQFLGPMRKGLEGSAIVVTTRSKKVAENASKGMKSMSPIYLKALEENIYWVLFKNCSFGLEENAESYLELKEIGKQICKKLKGSPLAAKTIGGLLKVSMDVKHWTNIRDSKIWQLKQEEHDILPVLQLSYQYLPSHLKKCFSFCSLYPKDFNFTKTELAKFWIMHGFIKCQENQQQMLDILAEDYFNELVSRSFFQQAAGSSSEEYVIHDLMHDLCQSITKDECFCLEDEDLVEKVSLDIRYLSVFLKKLNMEKENTLIKYKKLLSLTVVIPCSTRITTIECWWNNLTSIRSLSLVNCCARELPESIGNLKHLHYLDISFSGIKKLPNSICSLYNLKYLNMEGSSCYCSFPEGSEKLISLQIFYFPRWGMPLVGSVLNLAKTIVAKDLHLYLSFLTDGGIANVKIQNLKHINFCGSLTINCLEVVSGKDAAEEAELNKKALVNELHLCWSDGRSLAAELHDEEVLQGLCPHPNLKSLTISGYGGKNLSPNWLKNECLPKLTSLCIWDCVNDFTIFHFRCSISELEINNCRRVTNLENCLRPELLPALKHLNVWNCNELMSLPVESFGGFSFLETVSIYDCPKLTCLNTMVLPSSLKNLHLGSCGDLQNSIPSCLQNLTSLEKLTIGDCLHLVSIAVEAASNLKSLLWLNVSYCAELQSFGGLQFLASLKKLDTKCCPKLEETGGRDIKGKLPSELLVNSPSSYIR